MNFSFRKIGLAVAFSPTVSSLLAETVRLCLLFDAQLILIHVGNSGPEEEAKMNGLIQAKASSLQKIKVRWETGDPVRKILEVTRQENIDLLVAGALKKENLVQYYIGTIARKLMRKAECSFLMLTNASETPASFQHIVVNAEDSPYVEEAIAAGCMLGLKDHSQWVHIVRELKLLGLTLSANEQCTEEEYTESRNNMMRDEITAVEKILERIPHDRLKINIKMVSGKSGFELARFAEKKHANLLIVGAPARTFSIFDRVFTHDLEYIFADMPCNLLMIHPRKEATRG